MRRTCLLLAALIACSVANGVLPAQEKKLAQTARPAAVDSIHQALQKKLSVEFVKTPLTDVIDFFRAQLKIEIKIRKKALEDAGIELNAPISLSLKDVAAGAALKHVLRQYELALNVRDNVLLVTTSDDLNSLLTVRVYDVADLVGSHRGQLDFDSLIELIVTQISPQSWDEVGGPGSISEMEYGGQIVVAQVPEILNQVEQLLAGLRRAEELHKKDPQAMPVCIPLDKEERKFGLALAQRGNIDVKETPLSDVADFISKQIDLPVLLNGRALEDAGLAADTKVTCQLQGVTWRTALDLLLEELELVWVVDNELLLVTTTDDANTRLTTRIYPARDLMQVRRAVFEDKQPLGGQHRQGRQSLRMSRMPPVLLGQMVGAGGALGPGRSYDPAVVPFPPTPEGGLDADSLVELIVTTIHPQAWDEVGGPGNIGAFRDTGNLVVTQTAQVHFQIEQLLTDLRMVRSAPTAAASPRPETAEVVIYHLKKSIPAAPSPTAEEVGQLITFYIEPGSWRDKEVSLMTASGVLVIRQKPAVHQQIQTFLRSLRVLDSGEAAKPASGGTPTPAVNKESQGGSAIAPASAAPGGGAMIGPPPANSKTNDNSASQDPFGDKQPTGKPDANSADGSDDPF